MGNILNKFQRSKAKENRSLSCLHPSEKRRLTLFLEERKCKFRPTYEEIKGLWSDILTPSSLESYANFILKSAEEQKEEIDLDVFVSIYTKIIRGSSDEKANAIAGILGSKKNQEGLGIISYQCWCNYLIDLVESYFLGLKSRNEDCYSSWTQTVKPRRASIEAAVRGICNDLRRSDDDVSVHLFEDWLYHNALIDTLHSYVLGRMYNLEPERDSRLIPFALFPSSNTDLKASHLLELPQVLYLNSFLPAEYREVWRLLFSTEIHGESFSKLVGCIVNQGPILLVVRTDSDNTFGGYISENVTLGPKWFGSESSFLFKLGSSVDVFPGCGHHSHYAYFNNNQTTMPNGLGMGGLNRYWGLWIDSHFGKGECSDVCVTYKHYKMLDSQKRFNIKRMEVWAVGEPPLTEKEMKERMYLSISRRSALDQYPTETQVLEMTERELHSKPLRDSLLRKKN